MRKIQLHWKIIIGLILGVLWAFLSSYLGWSEFTKNWIDPWGRIFINLLKLIAVPLVLFSIIKGISGFREATKLGRLSAKTLTAYLITTVMAISLGLVLVNIIKPGTFTSEEQRTRNRINYELWASSVGTPVLDDKSFLNNPNFEAEVAQLTGEFEKREIDLSVVEKVKIARKTKESGPLQFVVDMVPSNIFFSLNNNNLMLQVIFFAILFGVVLILIPQNKVKPVTDFVDGMNEVFLKMVDVVMQGAPFFVFALLAGKISSMAGDDPKNVIDIFMGLGVYSIVVITGLAIMIFIIYPIVIKTFTNKIPYTGFFRGIGPAQLLAFSTSSSAATLPVTMDCVRENLGVSREITSFVLPIGATVNMDGTSLYQAVAVVFLAQFHMVDLGLAQQLTIVLTATLASIGSAAVPGAGLVMMILVLGSVGLDPAWIAIILPVDRILDMCRTVVNVTGDATVSTVIANSENELDYQPHGKIANFEI